MKRSPNLNFIDGEQLDYKAIITLEAIKNIDNGEYISAE